MVQSLEFRFIDVGFEVQEDPYRQLCSRRWRLPSAFRIQGSGFRVQGLGFRVQNLGFRVKGLGFKV
jgi:hypothetical protein